MTRTLLILTMLLVIKSTNAFVSTRGYTSFPIQIQFIVSQTMKHKNINLKKKMHQLLTMWEHSGMSLRAFSKTQDISYDKLRYWRKELKIFKKDKKEKIDSPSKDTPNFISIEVPNPSSDFIDLELTFPNNVKLNFPSGITIDSLKKIIKLF